MKKHSLKTETKVIDLIKFHLAETPLEITFLKMNWKDLIEELDNNKWYELLQPHDKEWISIKNKFNEKELYNTIEIPDYSVWSKIIDSPYNKNLSNVIELKKSKSAAKSDFEFVVSNEEKKESAFWISHKAKGFSYNGYGSLGRDALESRSKYKNTIIWGYVRWAINSLIEDEIFIGEGKEAFQNPNSEIRGVWSEPSDYTKNLIEYGARFGSEFGEYNCNINAIGLPIFFKYKNNLQIAFEGGISLNGTPSIDEDMPIIGIMGKHHWDKNSKGKLVRIKKINEIEGLYGYICAMPLRAVVENSHDRKMLNVGKFKNMKEMKWKGDEYYANYYEND